MKADQIVELTETTRTRVKALDQHFTNDNCCGVLYYQSITDNLGCKVYQFVCRKCHRVIQVNEKENQS